jgi:hypothetical protein
MPEAVAATRPYPTRPATAGALTPALAAAAGAIACLLPWFRVDLSKLGAALDHAANDAFGRLGNVQIEGAPMAGFGEAMNGVFGTLGVQGTVTAAGIDSWVGVTVLILLAVSATLQLVASSADNGSARTMVTVSLVGSVLATCFSLYACTQLGGPVGPHIGLGIAVVAAAVATTASVRRLGSLPAAA